MKQLKIYLLRTFISWLKWKESYYTGNLKSWLDNASKDGFIEFEDEYIIQSFLVLIFDCDCVMSQQQPLDKAIDSLEIKIGELLTKNELLS